MTRVQDRNRKAAKPKHVESPYQTARKEQAKTLTQNMVQKKLSKLYEQIGGEQQPALIPLHCNVPTADGTYEENVKADKNIQLMIIMDAFRLLHSPVLDEPLINIDLQFLQPTCPDPEAKNLALQDTPKLTSVGLV